MPPRYVEQGWEAPWQPGRAESRGEEVRGRRPFTPAEGRRSLTLSTPVLACREVITHQGADGGKDVPMDHFLSCVGGLEGGFWVTSGGAAAEKPCPLDRSVGELGEPPPNARFLPGTLLRSLHAASRLPLKVS